VLLDLGHGRCDKGYSSLDCIKVLSHGISGYNTAYYSWWICDLRNRLKPVFQNQVVVNCVKRFDFVKNNLTDCFKH
jgi:hypothetical protein